MPINKIKLDYKLLKLFAKKRKNSQIPLTKLYLSVGDERARTRSLGQTLSNMCC